MMNKTKVKEIIKFSFFKYFQNKWFVLFNIITLISIVVSLNFGNITKLLQIEDKVDTYEVAVVDNDNLVYDDFAKQFEENEIYSFSKIEENTYTNENIKDKFIVIEVLKDSNEIFTIKLISKEGIPNNIYNELTDSLKGIRNKYFEEKYSLENTTLSLLQSNITVDRIMLSVDAENPELKTLVNLFASALTYLISVIVFTRIANEISQEKSSKSSEYILTAVTGKEYLFAKVFSNIAILVIQIILLLSYYIISAGILSLFKAQTTDISLSSAITISGLSKDIVLYLLALIFYNIVALILMSIIQATLAAKTTSSSEAGNTVSIMVFVMALMYILTVAIIDPYSKASAVLYIISMLPVISSFFVPAMIVIGQATWWQFVISIILMFIIIPKAFNYCSVVFKNGLLDYTKKKKKTVFDIEPDSTINTLINKREFKQLGSIIGISLLIYIGSQLVIPLLINIIIGAFFNNMSETDKFLTLQMFSQISCLGLAFLFLKSYINKNDTIKNISKTVIPKSHILFIMLALIVILQLVLTSIYPFIGLDYDITNEITTNSNSPVFSKILLIVTLAVVPAVFEELFFRKGLIDLCEKHGKKFALILSALLFGFIHMNISQGIFAFALGILMGLVYLYTKDIKLTMLIHFLNNGFAAVSMIIPSNSILQFALGVLVIITVIVGTIELIYHLSNKEFRTKLLSKTTINTKTKNIRTKYIYMFYDYIFDISIILVFILSIMTEKFYRNM